MTLKSGRSSYAPCRGCSSRRRQTRHTRLLDRNVTFIGSQRDSIGLDLGSRDTHRGWSWSGALSSEGQITAVCVLWWAYAHDRRQTNDRFLCSARQNEACHRGNLK